MKNIPKHKWILISCAIALALVGLIIINIREEVMDAIPLVVGIPVLIVGVVRLIYGIVVCRQEKDFYYQIIFGGISMAFGIVFLVFHLDAILFFVLFSLCILAEAITEWATGTNKAYEEMSGVGMIVIGAIKLAFGLALMIRPAGSTILWVIVVGIYFVLYAATMILVTINTKHNSALKQDETTSENK